MGIYAIGAFLALSFSPRLSHQIYMAPGAISATIAGTMTKGVSQTFLVHAKKGQHLIVNVYGTTKGFGVVGTVKAPNGQMDGGKQMPSYDHTTPAAGNYTISVGLNQMAATTSTGKFVLEVVLY